MRTGSDRPALGCGDGGRSCSVTRRAPVWSAPARHQEAGWLAEAAHFGALCNCLPVRCWERTLRGEYNGRFLETVDSYVHRCLWQQLAFDTIMVFGDRFKNHILPEQILYPERCLPRAGHAPRVRQLHRQHRLQPQSCWAKIRRSWRLWAISVYRGRFDALGLSLANAPGRGQFYRQAFITTDLDDNQITAFHPGAMTQSHLNRIDEVAGARLGIVAPDGRDGMLAHAAVRRRRVLHFDPGQGLPMFSGEEPLAFMQMGHLLLGQRLRGPFAHGADRAASNPSPPKRRWRSSLRWCAGPADPHRRANRPPCLVSRRMRSSTQRVAAMPIARVCSTALREGTIGKRPDGWPRHGVGKDRVPGGQNHAPTGYELAARYAAALEKHHGEIGNDARPCLLRAGGSRHDDRLCHRRPPGGDVQRGGRGRTMEVRFATITSVRPVQIRAPRPRSRHGRQCAAVGSIASTVEVGTGFHHRRGAWRGGPAALPALQSKGHDRSPGRKSTVARGQRSLSRIVAGRQRRLCPASGCAS